MLWGVRGACKARPAEVQGAEPACKARAVALGGLPKWRHGRSPQKPHRKASRGAGKLRGGSGRGLKARSQQGAGMTLPLAR
jgi:hypothetical protein